MINYSGLPQRVKRIVKTYEYCIESVQMFPYSVHIRLKEGYLSDGNTTINGDAEKLIPLFKAVTKPSSKVIRTALFGFSCPLCNRQVLKGTNYTDFGGMRICGLCG